ncbi:type I methionyl aminopeptidase [Clostridia bacterium]|nr:type I methionyl aminopeptidase [Clostridia bacterium]
MITIKNDEDIKKMREAGRIVAQVHDLMRQMVRPGISTAELNQAAEQLIYQAGAEPSFKGYGGFPAGLCISIDDEVVHGIPGELLLKEGTIVSIDAGAYLNGFHGDAAISLPVGEIDEDRKRLLKVTEESLYKGIEQARIGNRLGDVSHAVQSHCEKNGFSVVRDYVGHGIGENLHEDPQVPNYGPPHRGLRLQEHMAIAIEPMVNLGKHHVKVLSDGWTVKTLDGKPSAHFEHTIVITAEGPQIMTKL